MHKAPYLRKRVLDPDRPIRNAVGPKVAELRRQAGMFSETDLAEADRDVTTLDDGGCSTPTLSISETNRKRTED